MKDAKSDILWRVYFLYGMILLWAMAIIGRIAYIQIYMKEELMAKAEQQEIRVFDIEAMRGNILAQDGNLLSTTVPIFEVRMDVSLASDQKFNQSLDSLAIGLSKVLKNKTTSAFKQELRKARKNGNRYLLLKREVTYAEVKMLRKLPILRDGKFKGGLILIPGSKRERPYKELAQRTIGYENQRENLYVGIEGAYHESLKGTNGKHVKRRINNGDWKPLFDENSVEPQNGKDVVTTIDVNIQDVAESALRRNLIENNAKEGCAILMEVSTGYIVAISNLRFDDKTGKYRETYNYAIAESVEPGSTFKLASMIALLEDQKTRPTDSLFIGNGQKKFYSRTMKDVHSIRNGRITVQEAFEKSSNVAMATLVYNAYKDAPEKFIDHLHDMSLNKKLGIEITGEGKPYIKHPSDKKNWYGTSLPWMSIGYEIQMTPLQMLTFYNAVANNGKMVKPVFVKEIRQGNTVIEKFETVVINKSIASPKTIEIVKKMMEGVVENGTAKYLKDSPFKIAGKTGTAQIASGNKGYNKQNYTASFAGYFPAGNPKYSCMVVISNPSEGKIYGGAVAAPVFKEIADKVYASRPDIHDGVKEQTEYLAVAPLPEGVCSSQDAQQLYQMFGLSGPVELKKSTWIKTHVNEENTLSIENIKLTSNLTPDVTGMNAKDAVYLLESIGFHPLISGKGKVVAQSILPGSPVENGQKIELKLINL